MGRLVSSSRGCVYLSLLYLWLPIIWTSLLLLGNSSCYEPQWETKLTHNEMWNLQIFAFPAPWSLGTSLGTWQLHASTLDFEAVSVEEAFSCLVIAADAATRSMRGSSGGCAEVGGRSCGVDCWAVTTVVATHEPFLGLLVLPPAYTLGLILWIATTPINTLLCISVTWH